MSRWLRDHDGVISAAEATQLGISRSAFYRAVASGVVRRVAAGVYVDPSWPTNPRTTLLAALLAAGRDAVVSHRSAAWLWRLVEHAPPRPIITVPHIRRVERPLGVLHRTRISPLPRRQAGFPVTDPVRTLLDIAATTEGRALDVLIDRALSLRLVSVERLEEATRSQPRRSQPGTTNLRSRLALRGHLETPTPSVLEAHMGRLLRKLQRGHGVPPPKPELALEGGRYRLDYAWPEIGLALEVGGYVWHASAEQMRHDHHRRNGLAVDWTFLIFTWAQVLHEPEEVIDRVATTYWCLANRQRLTTG